MNCVWVIPIPSYQWWTSTPCGIAPLPTHTLSCTPATLLIVMMIRREPSHSSKRFVRISLQWATNMLRHCFLVTMIFHLEVMMMMILKPKWSPSMLEHKKQIYTSIRFATLQSAAEIHLHPSKLHAMNFVRTVGESQSSGLCPHKGQGEIRTYTCTTVCLKWCWRVCQLELVIPWETSTCRARSITRNAIEGATTFIMAIKFLALVAKSSIFRDTGQYATYCLFPTVSMAWAALRVRSRAWSISQREFATSAATVCWDSNSHDISSCIWGPEETYKARNRPPKRFARLNSIFHQFQSTLWKPNQAHAMMNPARAKPGFEHINPKLLTIVSRHTVLAQFQILVLLPEARCSRERAHSWIQPGVIRINCLPNTWHRDEPLHDRGEHHHSQKQSKRAWYEPPEHPWALISSNAVHIYQRTRWRSAAHKRLPGHGEDLHVRFYT